MQARLTYDPPLAWQPMRDFLAARGAPGVVTTSGAGYARGVQLDGHRGWITVAQAADAPALVVEISQSLEPVSDRLLIRLRHLFDLDANARVIDTNLQAHALLQDRVGSCPGLRVPGTLEPFELVLRTIIGQQVSVKAATTIAGRFARTFGDTIDTPWSGITHSGPDAGRIAASSIDAIAAMGLPRRRAQTVLTLAKAMTDGGLSLTPDTHPGQARQQLCAVPGIGDWSAQYISMRALHDANAFPATDLGVMRALGTRKKNAAIQMAEQWRPWRAYAVMHLWCNHGGG